MDNNSTKKTLFVAISLSIVCSVIVSTAATVLKPKQEYNKDIDRKKNILAAAGLLEDGATTSGIEEAFKAVEARVVDLKSGEFVDVDLATFNQKKVSKNPDTSIALTKSEDIAGVIRRENQSLVYLVKKDGKLDTIVLPVRGYGLWSTLWGFLALEEDANTIVGLGYYQHAETPGLGGEVDNPKWKGLWPEKKIFDADGNLAIRVVKGLGKGYHEIDGLAGATLTANGVTNMMQFWLGEQGFGPFLQNVQNGSVK